MANVTYSAVNAAIRKAGGAERLVHGFNKFYFVGGETRTWKEVQVNVGWLDELTVDQWVQKWRELSSASNAKSRPLHLSIGSAAI